MKIIGIDPSLNHIGLAWFDTEKDIRVNTLEVEPPFNPLWLKLGATDLPLLRCVVEGYAVLYEVDAVSKTVALLDVEREETPAASYAAVSLS